MHNTSVKILLIEDNPGDARLIREMLKEAQDPRFELEISSYLKDGLKKLINNGFDLILLDLMLPDSVGLDTFTAVNDHMPEIPIVILSGSKDEKSAIRAVREGAQDYLIKGEVDGRLLARAISYAIERKQIEDELIKHRYYLNDLVEERTAKLEKSNQQLKKEIVERKKAENEIKAALEEKKILIDEIRQRIQHNFELISSLVDFEFSQTNNKDLIEVYQESQNRVKAIALAHKKFDKSEDFAVIDFNGYIKDLIGYLYDVYAIDPKQIKVNIDSKGILLDIDIAVPFGLIINELVTNSLKHAFPHNQNGEIYISLRIDNGNAILTIKDNGIGLPENVNPYYPESSGLQLVNRLIRYSNGLMDVKMDNGTQFKIKINQIIS